MSTSRTIAYAGAGVSGVLAAVAVVDQVSAHWTRVDVARHYGGRGLHPDPNLPTTLLIAVFACAAGAFVWGASAERRRRPHLVRVLGVLLAVCGGAFAVLASTASEYGGPVLITAWRVLPWAVPVLAALLVVTGAPSVDRRVRA